MDLTGIPPPQMDWSNPQLHEAWKSFKQHIELIFSGPLANKDEKAKCSYLLLWIGEKGRSILNTWTDLTDDDREKLETYYTRYERYVQPQMSAKANKQLNSLSRN